MGLRNIRIVGDDWMLLDEDGDGVGCDVRTPFDRLAEEAGCESLYQPERTACRDELVADLEEQFDRQRAEEIRYDDDQFDDRDRDDEPEYDSRCIQTDC
jgi:hypothetical protein